MRQLKYGIFILLCLSFITLQVNAVIGTGICAGQDMDSYNYGSCDIIPKVNISSPIEINKQYIRWNDSTRSSALKKGYSGNIYGKNQMLFCIDTNYDPPNQPYGLARPLDVTSSDYDRSLAKAYGSYINQVMSLMKDQGYSKDAAFNEYFQIINIVMRAIIISYDLQMEGGSSPGNLVAYKNVVKQLKGLNPSGKKLQEDEFYYPILKSWYAKAMSSEEPVQIKLDFSSKNDEITNVYEGDNFTQTIPVIVKGLDKFTDPAYAITEPSFKFNPVESIKCENEKLTCSLESSTPVGINLIPDITGDEYEFKVIVKGDKTNFLDETSTKVIIEYEKYHILDTDNLAVLRFSNTAQKTQRMIALMPNTPQTASIKIDISIPSMCETVNEGGVQKYIYGGESLGEQEYLDKGCCNVDYNDLKNENARKDYLENCSTGDIIHLVNVCNNETNEMSHSYVYQEEINKIMDQVNGAEDMYIKGSYSLGTLKNTLSNYDNNIDRVYSEDGISPRNDYCKMYTSEKQDIYYPGTAEAVSGQFFVFHEYEPGKFQQPKIKGEIYADFHTDVNRWLKDYEAAIVKEKTDFTSWQEAAALEDAIDQLGTCVRTGVDCNCSCCWDGEDGACGNKKCGCDKKYKVSGKTPTTTQGSFYNSKGDRIIKSAEFSCECGGEAYRTSKPSPSASKRKSTYIKSKADRKILEKYKDECDVKWNIRDDWEYQLSPELTFYYKQKVNALSDSNSSETITETVPMEISKKSVKYWNEPTLDPVEISYFGDKENETHKDSYGNKSDPYEKIDFEYDKTIDYQIGYTQELFYKPSVYYYSLVPSGKYIKSQEKKEGKSVLDVGYVFNVEITNYEGEYETWFEIKDIGHLMKDPSDKPKLKSNIQNSVDDYIGKNKNKYLDHEDKVNLQLFASKCFYNNKEVLYQRDCLDCTDPNFEAQFFYRTISLNDVNPNDRKHDEKFNQMIKNVETQGDKIYDDNTRANLEYSFILDPNNMQDIKKYNNEEGRKYTDFELTCENNKDGTSNGKECKSKFVETWAENSGTTELLEDTRADKWKYFINEGDVWQWRTGSIDLLLSGTYPSEDEDYEYWP